MYVFYVLINHQELLGTSEYCVQTKSIIVRTWFYKDSQHLFFSFWNYQEPEIVYLKLIPWHILSLTGKIYPALQGIVNVFDPFFYAKHSHIIKE